ncbi:MAG: UDP-N-acetylmuramoyl-L-alanyl-D-glutamate--2,6-diaminopimelate ligase [Oscillospiraceae bacterium]|jgi:UDP-N-acetylmuramoyl-L-alanyl-D-glutamate--2,6-diaminopimelate ligase|nr:UDP-N-acetylmuramoyl-L-alanyl-D-glutamate--2,6-diaminopimelate ligase [Oscillospiraceae bacterium]
MQIGQLMRGVSFATQLPHDTEIVSITSDSRAAEKGGMFFCIKGVDRDGHDFAQSAAKSGAVIVCERDLNLPNQITVDDTRAAFAAACSAWYGEPLRDMKLIGITGTNGKTSTSYILKHILEQCRCKVGLIGTIQNLIGNREIEAQYTTPDTQKLFELFSQMRDANCGYCVMEVSSHALEQGRVKGLHFAASCFTNLTQDHLDFHGTLENYFAAKCKLFDMSDSAAINTDDKWGAGIVLPANVRRLDYSSLSDAAQLYAENPRFSAGGVTLTLCHDGQKREVSIPMPGRFSVYNAMSAVSCALLLGFAFGDVANALSSAKGVKGRAEVFGTNADFTVLIDYAHTPDGIENILSSIREVTEGRIISVVGCGGDRDPVKRPLMGEAAARLSDFVVVTSDNPRTEEPMSIIEQILPGVERHETPFTVIENRREAIEYAVCCAKTDDVVVLLGKGHETYQIIGTVKNHFDEREVLADIFERMENE